MKKLLQFGLILFVALSSLWVQVDNVQAQDGSTYKYFAETGHNVKGEFWIYYQSVANANIVFGNPITEEFMDLRSGRLVQYFQRVRFEYYPDEPAGKRVRLTPIGQGLYKNTGRSLGIFTAVGCRSFSTGHSICYAFLDFFDKYGGEAVFGSPISDFEIYNGRIVQYFSNARFEWYPELAEGQKVRLSELGRIYFDSVPEDIQLLRASSPLDNDIVEKSVLSLQARAFAWKTVVLANEKQSVYVVVQDQTLRPVPNAFATVVFHWADGTTETKVQPTNANGVATVEVLVKPQAYGSLITVDVTVDYKGLTSQAVTSFRIWR